MPHLASECLERLNMDSKSWPNLNKKYLIEENVTIVVQFNGKKRGTIEAIKNVSEQNLIKDIQNSKLFDKFLKENKIKKYFYVKDRLINILI